VTDRTKREMMSFAEAFTLPGLEGSIPAGSYEVETEEELLEQLSFPVYRRVSTTIRLPMQGGGASSYQIVRVDPADLSAAGGKRSA
jgi:hypothetical protein